jgi:hypothetical protein
VRITGRFKGYAGGQSVPIIEVLTVQYKRPQPFQKNRQEFFEFLESETESRIYLRNRLDFQTASYMLPLISFIPSAKGLSNDEQAVVSWYLEELADKLPPSLKRWYGPTEPSRQLS